MALKYYVGRVSMMYNDEGYDQGEGVSNIVGEFDSLAEAQAFERQLNAAANKRNVGRDYGEEPELYMIVQLGKAPRG